MMAVLPALPPRATAQQRASLRGAADGAALWLAHHDFDAPQALPEP